jgi:hypothetical protein
MGALRPLHHPGRALGAGLLNGILLLALPYGLTTLVLGILGSGGVELFGGTPRWTAREVAPLVAWIEGLQRLILIVGGAATLLAALAALFAKGTAARLLFGLGRQGARFAWLAVVLAGGLWTLRFDLGGSPFGALGGSAAPGSTAVVLTLDLTGIFALAYGALAATALYLLAEFLIWRRKLRRTEAYMAGVPGELPPPPPGP